MTDKQLWLAETIADCLKDEVHWYGRCYRAGLKKLRREFVCVNSQIQEYKCHTPVYLPKNTEKAAFACDLCLKNELYQLNAEHGIQTIGSCCGHGKHRPFIQVAPEYVQKMHILGYEEIPVDKYGNGKWCFVPKTDL